MERQRQGSHDFGDPGFAAALGRTIKVLRTELDISRRDLAQKAGVSYSYITEIENGNKPPSSTILGRIAEALGSRRSELVQAAEDRLDSQEMPESPMLLDSDDTLPQPRLHYSAQKHLFALQPSLRGQRRNLRAAVLELERLLSRMAPDDIERVLDYARRLAR